MAGNECTLYACCPLRIFYETSSGGGDWIKKYCRGSFRKCGRYKLEALAGIPPCPAKPPKAGKGKKKR